MANRLRYRVTYLAYGGQYWIRSHWLSQQEYRSFVQALNGVKFKTERRTG